MCKLLSTHLQACKKPACLYLSACFSMYSLYMHIHYISLSLHNLWLRSISWIILSNYIPLATNECVVQKYGSIFITCFVSSVRWIYLSTSHDNPGQAWKVRPIDGITSAEINPPHARNNIICIFSHNTHRKDVKNTIFARNFTQYHQAQWRVTCVRQRCLESSPIPGSVFTCNLFHYFNTKLINL
jgi:hypothetical protein